MKENVELHEYAWLMAFMAVELKGIAIVASSKEILTQTHRSPTLKCRSSLHNVHFNVDGTASIESCLNHVHGANSDRYNW